MQQAELRAAIEAELRGNLLPFWRERAVDPASAGFIAEMAHDGTVRREAPRGLILTTRLLWTFSALYRRLGEARDLALARRAQEDLEGLFGDRRHGGYRWRVDAAGRALDEAKKIYGQAFCVYALSEYHRASGEAAALEAARRVWERIERHAHDPVHGGYLEALAADWSPTAELRLSDKDMNAAKSMNNHLHLLEAYANLYRAWPDATLAARVRELLEVFDRHIIARFECGPAAHLRHFFDERWRPCSEVYSYGHDLEAAWLMSEAAAALGDESLAAAVERWGIDLARAALAEALDDEGGLAYAGRDGAVIDSNREWWCQAEAVVGFWHAYQLSAEASFAEAARRVWNFVERRMVDRTGGEWFWRVRADGSVDETQPKVSEWKGPYHNTRMCLQMMQRIGGSTDGKRS